MSEYSVETIYNSDLRALKEVDRLLAAEGISRDRYLDYTAGIYNNEGTLIATGSCYGNTLRSLAVDGTYRGEGLLATLLTHLCDVQFNRGNMHLFLYTKCDTAKFFGDLGFYEIARVSNQVVFMENRSRAFQRYLDSLKAVQSSAQSAAIVMNANPFTFGHQHLVEHTAKENDVVHLFVLSEDASLVPFEDRIEMVRRGVAHLKNVHVAPSGLYMISSATFPSYFLKDDALVTQAHALLDAQLFVSIAKALNVSRRYMGEEPFSQATNLYNQALLSTLPPQGIDCVILPRLEAKGAAVSASYVRQSIHDNGLESVRSLVPQTTYDYLASPQGKKSLDAIHACGDLIHH